MSEESTDANNPPQLQHETPTVRIFDLPEARKIIDELRREAADWKERALNAERRLQVYSSRTQSLPWEAKS